MNSGMMAGGMPATRAMEGGMNEMEKERAGNARPFMEASKEEMRGGKMSPVAENMKDSMIKRSKEKRMAKEGRMMRG